MGSTLVYGDGVDDIKVIFIEHKILKNNIEMLKEFFSGTFSRGSRRGEGGGIVCTRPIILGSVMIIW